MVRQPVESSNLAAIGYDPVTQTLEVAFRPAKTGLAAVWQYESVGELEHAEMMAAPSIGKAFTRIRDTHPCRRIGTIGPDGVERSIYDEVAG